MRVFETDPGRSRVVRASVWLLLVAGLLSSFLVVVFARWAWDVAGGLSPAAPPPDAPPVAAASPPPPAPVRVAAGPTPPVRKALQPTPEPVGGSEAEPEAGPTETRPPAPTTPTGIALFPPPGTDPPKVGVVVPEDWPLPEGYVRHYQTTDDGQMLQAILMFHPDYELLDERGEVIPLPEDLVVPPDLAPPGMPIERLEIPAPRAESEGTDAADPTP